MPQHIGQAVAEIAYRFYSATPFRLWVGAFVVGFVLERLLRNAEGGQPLRGYLRNVAYSLVYLMVIFLASPYVYLLIAQIRDHISAGPGLMNLQIVDNSTYLNQLIILTLYLLIVDFFQYLVASIATCRAVLVGSACGAPHRRSDERDNRHEAPLVGVYFPILCYRAAYRHSFQYYPYGGRHRRYSIPLMAVLRPLESAHQPACGQPYISWTTDPSHSPFQDAAALRPKLRRVFSDLGCDLRHILSSKAWGIPCHWRR